MPQHEQTEKETEKETETKTMQTAHRTTKLTKNLLNRLAHMTDRGGGIAHQDWTRQDWARQERQARLEAQQHGMNDSRTSLMLGTLGGVAAVVMLIMWAAR